MKATSKARTGTLRTEQAAERDRQFVTALARGLDILRCFTPSTPALGTTDIARITNMPQPTVWRLCHTMVQLGFLRSAGDGEKLQPGLPVLGLGYAVLAGHPIGELARPYMQEIADRHQGAVSLGAPDGLSMIYLQRCQGSLIVLPGLRVGSRVPLAYSATGWAYIAGLPASGRRALLAEIRKAEGKAFKAVAERLDLALATFDQTGFIINEGSLHKEINAVAVPVRAEDGSVSLTLSSGGISAIFQRTKLDTIGEELKALAAQLGPVLSRTTLA
jgi:DNA-binding IclR family transcriptional regulator